MNFVQLLESVIKGEPIDVLENKDKIVEHIQKAFKPLLRAVRESAEKSVQLVEKIETYSSGLRYFVDLSGIPKWESNELEKSLKQVKNKLKIDLFILTTIMNGFRTEMHNPPLDLRENYEIVKKNYELSIMNVISEYAKEKNINSLRMVSAKIDRHGSERAVFELQSEGFIIGKIDIDFDTKNIFLVLPPNDEKVLLGTVRTGIRNGELTISVKLDIQSQVTAKLIERVKNIKGVA